MSGDERDAFEANFVEAGHSLVGIRRELVASCLCDEQGKRTKLTANQRLALGRCNGAVLDRLFSVCQTINAMRKEDLDAAGKKSSPDANGSG